MGEREKGRKGDWENGRIGIKNKESNPMLKTRYRQICN
jgi:hypothetical protein